MSGDGSSSAFSDVGGPLLHGQPNKDNVPSKIPDATKEFRRRSSIEIADDQRGKELLPPDPIRVPSEKGLGMPKPGLRQFVGVPLALVLLLILAYVPIFPEDEKAAQQCLAILAFSAVLWATEAVPLFITGFFIAVLVVWFQVLQDTSGEVPVPLDREAAAKEIVSSMLSSTIFLCLAGFSLAAALKKYGLDALIAQAVLSRAAKFGPKVFLIILGLLTLALSAIVSNVTAPVLVLSFVQPYLERLPDRCSLKKCLVACVMVFANLGGMTTPISSPQNAVAVGVAHDLGLEVGFANFCIAGISVALICSAIGYLFIVFVVYKGKLQPLPAITAPVYRPGNSFGGSETWFGTDINELQGGSEVNLTTEPEQRAPVVVEQQGAAPRAGVASSPEQSPDSDMPTDMENSFSFSESPKEVLDVIDAPPVILSKSGRVGRILTVVIAGIAVVLWVCNDWTKEYLGDTGTVSLFIVVLFYGTGVLSSNDLVSMIPWTIICLLMGGNALGHAVESSNLLNLISDVFEGLSGWNWYLILIIIFLIIAVIATFISHTVSAIILLPILTSFIMELNAKGVNIDPAAIVVASVIMASGSMALPVSSFPNMTMTTFRNQHGNPVLRASTIGKVGVSMTVAVFLVMISCGWFIIDGVV